MYTYKEIIAPEAGSPAACLKSSLQTDVSHEITGVGFQSAAAKVFVVVSVSGCVFIFICF